MKRYKQLVKELPTKKVVIAFCKFQPPTAGHDLLINAVKTIAQSKGADYVIFASSNEDKKSNPLPVDRKIYYLKRMYPNTNFIAATDETKTLIDAALFLSKKYSSITVITSSDNAKEYTQQLNKSEKFNAVDVIAAVDKDPDADGISTVSPNKMRDAARKNDLTSFKNGLTITFTELDSKRLMNDMRCGMGLDAIKEHIKFETNELREKYFSGEMFKVDDIVESNGEVFKIIKRGSNHLLVEDESGKKFSKWPQDLQITEKQFKQGLDDMKDIKSMENPVKDPPNAVGHSLGARHDHHRRMKVKYHLGEEVTDEEFEITDDEINLMIDEMVAEDYYDAYDDEELCLIDEDTGDYIVSLKEDTVMEGLSRSERIRAKVRFARTEAKRERKIAIALKTRSNTATINKRARRLAIVQMKKRLAKKPLDKLSVSEKERIEGIIAKRKNVIDRIAMRLVPKVKRIESDRLSHKNFTKDE